MPRSDGDMDVPVPHFPQERVCVVCVPAILPLSTATPFCSVLHSSTGFSRRQWHTSTTTHTYAAELTRWTRESFI